MRNRICEAVFRRPIASDAPLPLGGKPFAGDAPMIVIRGIGVNMRLLERHDGTVRQTLDDLPDQGRRDLGKEAEILQVFLQLLVNLLKQIQPLWPTLTKAAPIKSETSKKTEAGSFYFETASAEVNYLVAFSRCLLRSWPQAASMSVPCSLRMTQLMLFFLRIS